jgi:hypothetical protein
MGQEEGGGNGGGGGVGINEGVAVQYPLTCRERWNQTMSNFKGPGTTRNQCMCITTASASLKTQKGIGEAEGYIYIVTASYVSDMFV